MTNINWDEVLYEQESDPANQPVPNGWQDVTVVKSEAVTASTGSPMVKLAVEIEGGPYDSRWVFTNLVFNTESSTNMRMVLRRLAAFGMGAEYLATNKPTMSQLADALMGRKAQAEVIIRRWNDEDRNDINMFRPRSGAATGEAPPPPPVIPADDPMPTPTGTGPTPPTVIGREVNEEPF